MRYAYDVDLTTTEASFGQRPFVSFFFFRAKVLRPMITVAPATHSFGTIHTERRGNATLFLGNPTFADAEWSLVHIPAPPPKKRLIHKNNAVKATATATTPTSNPARAASGAYVKGRHTRKPGRTDGSGGRNRSPAGGLFDPLVVDDPSVFVFGEEEGILTGVKLPLRSSAACLPEDWNRFEVRGKSQATGVRMFLPHRYTLETML